MKVVVRSVLTSTSRARCLSRGSVLKACSFFFDLYITSWTFLFIYFLCCIGMCSTPRSCMAMTIYFLMATHKDQTLRLPQVRPLCLLLFVNSFPWRCHVCHCRQGILYNRALNCDRLTLWARSCENGAVRAREVLQIVVQRFCALQQKSLCSYWQWTLIFQKKKKKKSQVETRNSVHDSPVSELRPLFVGLSLFLADAAVLYDSKIWASRN